MSRMLTFLHDGWACARTLARAGRRADALANLTRLLAAPDLPAPVAADARRLAAEVCLDLLRFAAARRHLRAALALEPASADTHALVGRSFEDDPLGEDGRAARWYAKAMRLAPGVAKHAAAFGRAAVRCGRVKRGLKALRTAAAIAPGNAAVVRVLVDGFLETGRVDDARGVVRKARFLRAAGRELDRLEARIRFEAARRGQTKQRKTQDATPATDGDFASLPFVRLVGADARPAIPGVIRHDFGSHPRPHVHRLRANRADRN